MKINELKKLPKEEFDSYFDENGLNSDGYSNPMVEHINSLANGPFSKSLSDNEMDDLLKI